eukprot:CAMPEP_0206420800 /NCGR_PEP_ID=MMETSP0324_2-20121206/1079_1 /ASSEMBLY_ACC=CAM_ASM_000836 /TAXON_ID=2866 /ORGANISM="Crypthecodinium cohnii, Strain Seligo" /LENGTH=285 /DNA_ID=CAMNT_0053884795 /DNA_START=209 /DNA_END=1063 /DNA_ORIENTATION=-
MGSTVAKGGLPQALALPSLLFLASAAIWRWPDRGLSVLLGLIGLCLSPFGTYAFEPHLDRLVDTMRGISAKNLSGVISATLLEFMRNEGETQQLTLAASDAIRRAITNREVLSTMKAAILEAARDEELQQQLMVTITSAGIDTFRNAELRSALLAVTKDAISEALKDDGFMQDMISTISMAMLSTAQNRELRDTALGVVKQAVTDALKDEGFMEDMLSVITKSAIAASGDVDLRNALLDVTKEAVTDALKDEEFIAAFRQAMCDSLKDGNIYRSAAAGVVGSLNP